jgi:hypothetical protein
MWILAVIALALVVPLAHGGHLQSRAFGCAPQALIHVTDRPVRSPLGAVRATALC